MIINYLYFLLAAIGIISALLILTSLNPINRLAFLIIVFMMSSFLFIYLDYYFLGLTYIIVYVGAIAILFLFVIMMAETLFTPTSDKLRYPSHALKILKIDNSYELSGSNSLNNTSLSHPTDHLSGNSLELPYPNSKSEGRAHGHALLASLLYGTYLNLEDSYGENFLWDYIAYIGDMINIEDNFTSSIYNFFYTSYTSEFLAFSDIQLFGFMLYLAFPFITVLLGVLLWCVLIGVLRISGN